MDKIKFPKIYLINTSNHSKYTNLIHFADNYIKLRANRLNDKQHISNTLVGCVARKLIIYKLFGIKNQEIEFNQHNKPKLKNNQDIHFNISHSENFVAIAVSSSEVGVDIQKIVEPNLNVVNYMFTESEKRVFNSSCNKSLMYTKIWTQKESIAKLLGTGMAYHGNVEYANIKTKTFRYGEYIMSYSVFDDCTIDN